MAPSELRFPGALVCVFPLVGPCCGVWDTQQVLEGMGPGHLLVSPLLPSFCVTLSQSLPLSCPPGCVPVSLREKDRQRRCVGECGQGQGSPRGLVPQLGRPTVPQACDVPIPSPQPGALPWGGHLYAFPQQRWTEPLSQAAHISLGNAHLLFSPLSCPRLV